MGRGPVSFDLAAIMDALAAATDSPRAFGYPVGSVLPPAVIVGYPTDIEFDATFNDGSHRLVIPVYFVCGKVDDKASRNVVAAAVSGANGVKAAIEADAPLHALVDTARVTNGTAVSFPVGAVDMIGIRFDVEVYT